MAKQRQVHYDLPRSCQKRIDSFERPKIVAVVQAMQGEDFTPDSISHFITSSKCVNIGNQMFGSMHSRQERSSWVLAYNFTPTLAPQWNSTRMQACKIREFLEVTCKVRGNQQNVLLAQVTGLRRHQHYNHFPIPTTVWSIVECDENMFLPVDLFICQLAHSIRKVKFTSVEEETVAVVTPIPTTTISQIYHRTLTSLCMFCLFTVQ